MHFVLKVQVEFYKIPGTCLLLRYVPYCFGLLENSVLSFWAPHRGCRGPQERQEEHQSGLCYHLSCCARDITTHLLFDTHTYTHSGTLCSHRNLLCLPFFFAVLFSVCSVSGCYISKSRHAASKLMGKSVLNTYLISKYRSDKRLAS